MATVTVRYWAAARHAAGITEDTVSADTLAAALAAAQRQLGADRSASLGRVLARSALLVDGNPVGARPPDGIRLAEAAVIEVLPPFAGG